MFNNKMIYDIIKDNSNDSENKDNKKMYYL